MSGNESRKFNLITSEIERRDAQTYLAHKSQWEESLYIRDSEFDRENIVAKGWARECAEERERDAFF